MSYCRFSEADIYLFYHVDGFFQCCACRLAPLVNTIFTKGFTKGLTPCPDCNGEGCKKCAHEPCHGKGCPECQMHGNTNMDTAEETLTHVIEHRKAGHDVPDDVFERLRQQMSDSAPKEGG